VDVISSEENDAERHRPTRSASGGSPWFRMLAEAKALGEVRIALSRGATPSSEVSKRVCASSSNCPEAIVAPLSLRLRRPDGDRSAAALGDHVSALLRNDMKIGLGWGRTLEPPRSNI